MLLCVTCLTIMLTVSCTEEPATTAPTDPEQPGLAWLMQQVEAQADALRRTNEMYFHDLRETVDQLDVRFSKESSVLQEQIREMIAREVAMVTESNEAHRKRFETLENQLAFGQAFESRIRIAELSVEQKLSSLETRLDKKFESIIEDVDRKLKAVTEEEEQNRGQIQQDSSSVNGTMGDRVQYLADEFAATRKVVSDMERRLVELFLNNTSKQEPSCVGPPEQLYNQTIEQTMLLVFSLYGKLKALQENMSLSLNNAIVSGNSQLQNNVHKEISEIRQQISDVLELVDDATEFGEDTETQDPDADGEDKENEEGSKGQWFTILRRVDGSTNFSREWNEYRRGFGDPLLEFWLGNDIIHQKTTERAHELRVDMEDWSGQLLYAEYSMFRVGTRESRYKLHVSGYRSSSTAGNSLSYHNSMPFSTIDLDNDKRREGSCSKANGGGGFWYKACHYANPCGLYKGKTYKGFEGISWYHAYRDFRSFKTFEMKIRPI